MINNLWIHIQVKGCAVNLHCYFMLYCLFLTLKTVCYAVSTAFYYKVYFRTAAPYHIPAHLIPNVQIFFSSRKDNQVGPARNELFI